MPKLFPKIFCLVLIMLAGTLHLSAQSPTITWSEQQRQQTLLQETYNYFGIILAHNTIKDPTRQFYYIDRNGKDLPRLGNLVKSGKFQSQTIEREYEIKQSSLCYFRKICHI